MARQRHVYPTHEIPHLWAHQTQDAARNPQGNLYFKGDTIYSYRDSYPIGRFVTNGENRAVLISRDTYSVTTSQHISSVRHAVRGMVPEFRVSQDVMGSPSGAYDQDEVTAYGQRVTDLLLKAKRARINKAWYLSDAAKEREEGLAFARFFGLDSSAIPELGIDLSAIEAARRANAANRRKEEKAREARLLADQAENIAAWKRGDGNLWSFDSHRIPTMLRIKEDRVETSRGASFPITHAKRGLALVRSVMAKGEDWKANGHTCHLGHYQIDRITKNGTVYAGCHVVEWPAIEEIAPQLEKYGR